ncbi:esterase, partial [Rhodococcus sp. NPDC058514]
MDWLLRWSLTSGPLPWLVTALGAIGGLWLLLAPTASPRRVPRRARPRAPAGAPGAAPGRWGGGAEWW